MKIGRKNIGAVKSLEFPSCIFLLTVVCSIDYLEYSMGRKMETEKWRLKNGDCSISRMDLATTKGCYSRRVGIEMYARIGCMLLIR